MINIEGKVDKNSLVLYRKKVQELFCELMDGSNKHKVQGETMKRVEGKLKELFKKYGIDYSKEKIRQIDSKIIASNKANKFIRSGKDAMLWMVAKDSKFSDKDYLKELSEFEIPRYEKGKQVKSMTIDEFKSLKDKGKISEEIYETYKEKLPLFTILYELSRSIRQISRKLRESPSYFANYGLKFAIEHMDHEVGKNFQAHGIAKGWSVESLINMLTNGIDNNRQLFTMPLYHNYEAVGLGAVMPFVRDGIVVISDYGKRLQDFSLGEKTTGTIKFVALGEAFVNLIDLFSSQFPDVKFVPWHDLQKVMTEEYNKHNNKKKRINRNATKVL